MNEHGFSNDLLLQLRLVQGASTKEDRTRHMCRLAEMFSKEHDHNDHSIGEGFHELIEEFDRAKLAYDQASLRLARAAMEQMDAILGAAAEKSEDPPVAVKREMN